MKGKITAFFIVTLMCVSGSIIGVNASVIKGSTLSDEWTIMVYLDGDNNLETYAINDFLEIADVDFTGSGVNVLVQMDRRAGYDYRYGNWEDARRGIVNYGDVPSDGTDGNPAWGVSIGETNVGDPQTLINFANWGISNYPADKYCLILWDHGDGWKGQGCGPTKSVCNDDTNGDTLEIYELRMALGIITNNGLDKIGVLGFDACLMGMLEVGYEVRDYCEYMTASEEVELTNGWNYYSSLNALVGNPATNAEGLGNLFVTYYNSNQATLSNVDLGDYGFLASATSDLATYLQKAEFRNGIQSAINNVLTFQDYDYVDLYHFAELLQGYIQDSELDVKAQAVMDEVSIAVSSEIHGSGYENAHGISTYVPYYNYDSSYEDLLYCIDTQWDEFLYWWFYGGGPSNAPTAPIINGPKSGQTGTLYEYSFNSTDPDNDNIIYLVIWGGNGQEEEIGPKKSGEAAFAKHSWSGEGAYVIKAQARDVNGTRSEWSYYTVTMPRTRSMTIFEKILSKFPIIAQFLNRLAL